MEIFDVVDEDGNPIGETVERTKAHAEGIRHRTAHIWIVRQTDTGAEVLMQKRSANKDSFPGRYDTSSAGHIHAGDDPVSSAIREIGEELGIKASPEDFEFAEKFKIDYAKEFHGKMFRDSEVAFVYLYRKPVDISSLKLQEEEVECVNWFNLDYVIEECSRHNQKFCAPLDGLRIVRRHINES